MNRLARGALAAVGGAVVAEAVRRVEGHENLWGMGDCAATVEKDGMPVPPNAQAATQEGKVVARNVIAAIDGKEPEPFGYKPAGQLVEIRSDFAVNQVMNVKLSGSIASLFRRATYLYELEGPQSRARIAGDRLPGLFFTSSVTQIRDR